MTPGRIESHRATFGHAYELKRRPDNGKAFCGVCRSKRNTAAVCFRKSVRGDGWEVIPQTCSRTPSRKLWPTHLAALKSYFHRAVFVEVTP